jgi:hypothetical protein
MMARPHPMTIILQAIGVLAAGLVLAWLLASTLSPLQRSRFAGVGIAATAIVGLLFVVHVLETGSGLPESTASAAKVSLFDAEHAGNPNANNAFLVWARDRMLSKGGRGSTYYLEPPAVLQNAELGQWSTYVLLPERATAKLAEADWVVFYEVTPESVAQVGGQVGSIVQFAPGYALARRSNAG